MRFILPGGQVHDRRASEPLLDGIEGDAGIGAAIPFIGSREVPIPHDRALYWKCN